MPRSYGNEKSLQHRSLTLLQFFAAVRASKRHLLVPDGRDMKICATYVDNKPNHTIMTVKNGNILPGDALFSSGERRKIGRTFSSLDF